MGKPSVNLSVNHSSLSRCLCFKISKVFLKMVAFCQMALPNLGVFVCLVLVFWFVGVFCQLKSSVVIKLFEREEIM